MNINDHVTFNKGDGTILTGRISRVWANKKYVTILTDGDSQTYVREIHEVNPIPAKHAPRRSSRFTTQIPDQTQIGMHGLEKDSQS